MSYDDQIDHAEHRYWSNYCPACDGPVSQCDGHDDDAPGPARPGTESTTTKENDQ